MEGNIHKPEQEKKNNNTSLRTAFGIAIHTAGVSLTFTLAHFHFLQNLCRFCLLVVGSSLQPFVTKGRKTLMGNDFCRMQKRERNDDGLEAIVILGRPSRLWERSLKPQNGFLLRKLVKVYDSKVFRFLLGRNSRIFSNRIWWKFSF